MAKILVTGGAGFIGSNFIRFWLKKHPQDFITNLDLLTYAGNRDTIKEFNHEPRVKFMRGDICDRSLVDSLLKGQDALFHFAAETHVDRSILDSRTFLQTNILGTQTLIESSRKHKIKRLIFISTDEVYGSIQKGFFRENSPLQPNSPYAASKASADLLCRSYWKTYQTPIIVTRCCNNFGPFHFPEKVIPLFITNLLGGGKCPIYGKGLNVREWIYVLDHCRAIEFVYRNGVLGEVYNIGSGVEMNNLELAKLILDIFGKSSRSLEFVKDRAGHDFRYALDSTKIKKLGWRTEFSFKSALEMTIDWYKKNGSWWKKIKDRSKYKNYIRKQYR